METPPVENSKTNILKRKISGASVLGIVSILVNIFYIKMGFGGDNWIGFVTNPPILVLNGIFVISWLFQFANNPLSNNLSPKPSKIILILCLISLIFVF